MVRHKNNKQRDEVEQADPIPAVTFPDVWGAVGSGAISQPCPVCSYAYSDGGYCGECGWSAPIVRDPYDTNRGKVW